MQTTMLSAAVSPAVKPASGIQMLDILGTISLPAATKSSAKTYPFIPDPGGEILLLADQFATDLEEWKALDASISISKAELTALARLAFYTANRGLMSPTSSVVAKGNSSQILVSFQNRYPGSADPEAITALIGPEAAGRYFYQSFELKIDGDAIPAAAAPAVIAAIRDALAQHGCADALSAAAKVKPTKEYHTARHAWDPQTNLALDRLVPPVAVVKIKS